MLTIVQDENHIFDCVRLFVEVFTGSPFDYVWITTEKAGHYIEDLMHTPGAVGFLWYEKEEPVGLCIGAVNAYFLAPQYEIKEFAVLPAYQGQGIGSAMLAEAEAHLIARGVAFLTLQTSRDIPAYGFYLKNGYTDIPQNAFLMKKTPLGV